MPDPSEHCLNESDCLDTVETSRRDFMKRGLAAMGGLAALSLAEVDEAHGDVKAPGLGRPKGPDDEAYWSQVRALFHFEQGLTYMNNGGLGVPPMFAAEAVCEGYRQFSRLGDGAKDPAYDLITEQVRPRLAKFIGAYHNEIALTRSATEGLNTIANGIDMKPGDEVLTSTHEHPAGLDPWLLKSKRYGMVVRQIRMPSPPESKEQVIDLFRKAITPRTKVLFFSHITRGPGLLYPAKELCTMAREHGLISAVDGAQSIGMTPLDLHDMGCDLFATSLHKWMLTPVGTGLLYIRRNFQQNFWPLWAGNGNRPWDRDGAAAFQRYEAIGTYEQPVRTAVNVLLDLFDEIGFEHIVDRNRMLSDYLKVALQKLPRVKLMTSTSHELSSPGITSIEIDGMGAWEIYNRLSSEFNIKTSTGYADGNNLIRISTHCYNSRQDVDELIAALKYMMPMT